MDACCGSAVSGGALTGSELPRGEALRGRGSTFWGVAAVAVATTLIGTIGTAAELGPDSLSPVATGAWRGVIGATGLLVVSASTGRAPWKYRLPIRWVLLAGCGVAAAQLAFFEAMDRTGVAVGTLVAIGVGPLMAGALDWLMFRRRPHNRWLAGVAVAMSGVVLLSGGAEQVVWSGVAFAVLAGSGIPAMGLAAQQLMKDRPLLTAMTTVMTAGAVFLLPVGLISLDTSSISFESVLTVLYLGLVTVTLAHWMWGAGLKRLTLSVAVVVGLLEPAVAATLAMTVLSEPATVALIAGICLVIAGVAVTSLSPVADRSS